MAKPQSTAGFALLYAVLLTSVVLTVGLGLSSILRKQIILSSTGAASQKAYYAANTIKECALHWGVHGALDEDGNFASVFGGWAETGTGEPVFIEPTADPNEIYCGDIALAIEDPVASGDSRIFSLDELEISGACARVEIILTPAGSTVVATGYNVGCDQTDNPRRVERQIAGRGSFALPF